LPEIYRYAVGSLQEQAQPDKDYDDTYNDAHNHAAVGQAKAFIFHSTVVLSVASRVALTDRV
jgi:hypothetical protein